MVPTFCEIEGFVWLWNNFNIDSWQGFIVKHSQHLIRMCIGTNNDGGWFFVMNCFVYYLADYSSTRTSRNYITYHVLLICFLSCTNFIRPFARIWFHYLVFFSRRVLHGRTVKNSVLGRPFELNFRYFWSLSKGRVINSIRRATFSMLSFKERNLLLHILNA